MRPYNQVAEALILDGDGQGGRAVAAATDRIQLDVEAVNRLLEASDLPPIEPEDDGVIALDSRRRPTRPDAARVRTVRAAGFPHVTPVP